MTTGQKWLGLLFLQAGLLGAAYGGGRYPEWQKRQAAEKSATKTLEELRESSRKQILLTRARSSLMEAALGVKYNNFGIAFERVIRAQSVVQNLKLPLQREFDELTLMLIAQKPEAFDKILAVAEKIEPTTPVRPPELEAKDKPAAVMVAGSNEPSPAPSAPTPRSEPAPRPSAPPAAAVPAPPAPSAPARNAAAETTPEATIGQSRAALLSAKELLISGSETSQIIAKLAHAQVVLEEAGHAEFSDQFSAAIKALRSHDEPKARSNLDAVLSSLRSL